jgi:hypothetical protein
MIIGPDERCGQQRRAWVEIIDLSAGVIIRVAVAAIERSPTLGGNNTLIVRLVTQRMDALDR